MPSSHDRIENPAKFIEIVKSASVRSAGSTLKGNLMSVRVRYTDRDGISQTGYCSILPTEISSFKLNFHKITRTFRMYCGGSMVRNHVDAWIATNPKEITDLEAAIKKAASDEYMRGDLTARKNKAVVEKCSKALREWCVHAFKHGMTREQIISIVDESVISSTMGE